MQQTNQPAKKGLLRKCVEGLIKWGVTVYDNKKRNVLFEEYQALLLQPSDVYRVAILGALKSGKSTFINAMVGEKILYSSSRTATTFPIRLVHKKDSQGLQLKYYYHEKKIAKFKKKVSKSHMDKNHVKIIMKFFDSLSKEQSQLTSQDIFQEIKIIDKIVSMINEETTIPVEQFITALVPEITTNFHSLKLFTETDFIENTVIIDTPGIGVEGSLNLIFQHVISYLSTMVESNVLILEKGGQRTSNEEILMHYLNDNKSFYVIAGKLDDYPEDKKQLLTTQLPNKFKPFKGFEKVYGVSQHRYLIGVKTLMDFTTYGHIIDTREPYIEELIKNIYSRKELLIYQKQKQGYETLLNENEEYKSLINTEYIGGYNQDFTTFLMDFTEKVQQQVALKTQAKT